jgi:hypothetical protein
MKRSLKFSRKLKPKRFNRATLVERKLGRERDRSSSHRYAFGQHHGDGLVEIDPRQREQTRLDTICHELLHHVDENDDWPESKINEAAGIFAKMLWEDGWRRVRL